MDNGIYHEARTICRDATTKAAISVSQKLTWLKTAINSDSPKGAIFKTHLDTIDTMKALAWYPHRNCLLTTC